MSIQQQQQFQSTAGLSINSTIFGFPGASNSPQQQGQAQQILSNTSFTPLTSRYAHLNKDPEIKTSKGAFCLFQPLGYCTRGAIMNGFCAFHIKQFNIAIKKSSMYICNENDKFIEFHTLSTHCLVPHNILKITQPNPEVGIIFPFIESETFDPENIAMFNTPGFEMTDEMYSRHIVYFKMFISPPADQVPEAIRRHRNLWVNYMSHRWNPKEIRVYCLLSNNTLVDVNACSLVTQAFLGLFLPQSNGSMAAPSSIIPQPEGFYLNFNSCVCGTTENSLGSQMFVPTQDRPPIIVDQVTTELDDKIMYTFKDSKRGC